MTAGLAENFDEQFRRPVQHLRLAAKTRGRVDVAFDAHDAFDLFEAPNTGLDLRQGIDAADPRGVPSVLLMQFRPHPPGKGDFLADERQLAAGDDEISRAEDRNISADRRRR